MDLNYREDKLDPSLVQDSENCMKEILPILDKYDLDIGARLQLARNGIVAAPEFLRVKSKSLPIQ